MPTSRLRHAAAELRAAFRLRTHPGELRDVLRAIGIGTVVLLVVVFALMGVLGLTRGTPVRAVLSIDGERAPHVGDTLFVRTVELYANTAIRAGNRVEVLRNGDETYPRFWADLRGARRTITAQFYYSQPGAVADTFASILAERRRAGVDVLLLLDAFGSGPLKGEWSERLARAGVRLAWLRPMRWHSLHKADQRSHVRAIVVDGAVGYTGGFGLADYWLGDGRHEGQWRETNVRFEGPAVAQLQAAFAAGWAEATGALLTGDGFFPPPAFDSTGRVTAGLMHTMPTIGSTPAERYLALTIASARRTLYVANSYFVPDDDFRGLLVRAAGRGVDVRVLVPGEHSDVKSTLWAGRYRYAELLRGGVRVYEYGPTNMHAKTMVADGVWSSVGSMNFDNRSLAFNDESTLLVADTTVGRGMDAMFLADLAHAREVTLADLRGRAWWVHLREWGANLLSRVL